MYGTMDTSDTNRLIAVSSPLLILPVSRFVSTQEGCEFQNQLRKTVLFVSRPRQMVGYRVVLTKQNRRWGQVNPGFALSTSPTLLFSGSADLTLVRLTKMFLVTVLGLLES